MHTILGSGVLPNLEGRKKNSETLLHTDSGLVRWSPNLLYTLCLFNKSTSLRWWTRLIGWGRQDPRLSPEYSPRFVLFIFLVGQLSLVQRLGVFELDVYINNEIQWFKIHQKTLYLRLFDSYCVTYVKFFSFNVT